MSRKFGSFRLDRVKEMVRDDDTPEDEFLEECVATDKERRAKSKKP